VSRRREWVAVTLVLLLAAVLRAWNLGSVPPGLSHDEVANGMIAQDILSGKRAVYFTAAYGHEPLYQYAQAATVAVFGENWLGLRWPSLAFGLLGIAVTYVLVRRLFSPWIAVVTITGLSVSFWPLFYARVGLRAISLPFTAALAAYFLFRTLDQRGHPSTDRSVDHIFGGIFLGLSLYTYMAARMLPFILASFLVYRTCVATNRRVPWMKLVILCLIASIVAAPLVVWLARHPEAEYRIAEVREPLDRLLHGDPSLVWHNLVANLLFFSFSGDPWPHQGIPGRPIFSEPAGAVLFWVGVAIAIWRWRRPQYGFLILWLVGALVPSILSAHAPPGLRSDAPSSVRNILGLVTVFIFPALTVVEAGNWIRERVKDRETPLLSGYALPLAALLFLPALLLTVRDYYFRWPRRADVRYFYQADLSAVAHELDLLDSDVSVTVAGLSVHSMDLPTLAFTAQRSVQSVRVCDPRQTLVIPESEVEARILVPQVVPFDEGGDLRERLTAWSHVSRYDAFSSYSLRDRVALNQHLDGLDQEAWLPDGTSVTLPASYSDQLTLVGYERLEQEDDQSVVLLTYWRVEDPPPAPVKVYMHLVGDDGIVAQDDGLASPPRTWESGDLVIQKHALEVPPERSAGLYGLRVGLYNDSSRARQLVRGYDALLLTPVLVVGP